MKLDLLIRNATIHTMAGPGETPAERIGIWKGRIVGLDKDLDGLTAAEELDASGLTIVPGLFDSHTHLEETGFREETVVLDDAGSVRQACRLIAERARTQPDGWILATGYEEAALGGSLTAADLDAAAPGRQVRVQHTTGHSTIVSTAALLAAGIDPHGPLRDGVLHEADQQLLDPVVEPVSLAAMKRSIVRSARQCRAEGITFCVDAGIGAGFALGDLDGTAFLQLRKEKALPVRVQLMPYHAALHPPKAAAEDTVTRSLDLGLGTGFGDPWLSLGAVKVFADGGMMVRGAYLREPYLGGDDPAHRGQPMVPADEIRSTILEVHASGWDVAIHAIGDAGLDIALDAFAEAQQRWPRTHRHRIEHGGLIHDDQIARLAALKIAVSTQPCFIANWGRRYSDILGPDRARLLYRARALIDAGITVAGGTDRPLPGTALTGIQTAVDRRAEDGTVIDPDERVTARQALDMYTRAAAESIGMGHAVGTLEPGKLADLTFLRADPLAVPAPEIGRIEVAGTAIDGLIDWT